MQLIAYQTCCETKITFREGYTKERYDIRLKELTSDPKTRKIIQIDDEGVETVILDKIS